LLSAALGLLAAFAGCARDAVGNRVTGGVRVEDQQPVSPRPASAPQRMYVADFKLDAEATEPKKGLLDRPRFLQKLTEDDPATRARKIVDEMATSLVRDLRDAGIAAERWSEEAPLPREGWLIRGVFTEASSGDTPRRALIGFGAGKSEMEVQVGVCDLATDPQNAFIVFGTSSDPSRLPGGLLTRNPYVVAAKFVLEKGAPGRDIKHTAQAIADEIVKARSAASR
jgi:hypothetical protein